MSRLTKYYAIEGINQMINDITEMQVERIFKPDFKANLEDIREQYTDMYYHFEDMLSSDDEVKQNNAKYVLSFLAVIFSALHVEDVENEKVQIRELKKQVAKCPEIFENAPVYKITKEDLQPVELTPDDVNIAQYVQVES